MANTTVGHVSTVAPWHTTNINWHPAKTSCLGAPIFYMTPRKFQREWKTHTIREQKEAPSTAVDPKISRKVAHMVKKTALKAVTTGTTHDLPELPTYKPPLNLQFKALKSLATGLTELHTFQKLLTSVIMGAVVDATNSYAKKPYRNPPSYSMRNKQSQ